MNVQDGRRRDKMEKYTRVRAKVDLDAVEYNVDRMKDNTEQGVEVVVVIKADG